MTLQLRLVSCSIFNLASPTLFFPFLVWNQIQSTKNLSKITSSMKMVSAAKLKGEESRLKHAKAHNAWTDALKAEPIMVEFEKYEELPQRILIVPFTSEKGLCGGVNSYVSRAVRNMHKAQEKNGKEADIVVFGDKGRAQLKRTHDEQILRTATDVISPGNFNLASGLASELISVGAADYDAVVLVYNKFINAATYNSMYKIVTPFATQVETGESMSTYEFDSDKAESMEDLYEFLLASQIHHSFMEAATSEQSSRMTAMENASQNANEMIKNLTLKYNRVRQARITTELIEIISGASAVDNKKK
jgi:F-type H+-transporting ATPase subunit gamma